MSTVTSMHSSVQKLSAVIGKTRDILRKSGITDMDSMMHCVLFTCARMLSADTLNLLKLPHALSWDKLNEKIQNRDISAADTQFKSILNLLDTKFGTKGFPYRLESADDFVAIMKAFHEVDIKEAAKHTDILGYIYEEHLGKAKGNGGGRELGKFYTDRQITKYLAERLGTTISATGRPDSMCDATMGTGGFILSHISMVAKKFPNIKWDPNDLAGGDIDDKVAAIARLNVFLHTGVVFSSIRKRDTLTNDIGMATERRTFDRVLMNIPFGVKNLTLASCCDRVKEIVKAGTKSEPLFLALCCKLLAEGGKAAIIVPDSVLTGSSQQNCIMRKHLLDNYNVKAVIKMRGKFFMNTGIQPSVLVFENTGKTTAVEFWDVEKGDELIETLLVTVPRSEFDDSCIFDVRRYEENEKEKERPVGKFPLVRLGDALKYCTVKRPVATTKSVDGPYNLYSSSCDVFKHNEAEFPAGEYLIQGSRGTIAKATHFETGAFSASNNVFVCKSAGPTISLKFIYYYLSKTKITDEIAVTSVIPMLTKTLFNEILIPLPPLPIQEQYVKELDENEAKIAEAKASLAELVAASEADARAMIEKLKA